MFKKILIATAISMIILVGSAYSYITYASITYYDEMNSIKDELNTIPNVSVVNIWAGNHDITLEEVTVRLKIEGKGELVLYGLSNDVFDYPNMVLISEIGGYSFRVIYRDSYGHDIDIGNAGQLKELFPFELNNPKDVIDRYDDILKIVKQWSLVPKLNHIQSTQKEFFVAVIPQKVHDGDDFIKQDYRDNFAHYVSSFSNKDYDSYNKFWLCIH